MLHEPLHAQLARLGLRGAADALVRLQPDDALLDALALLLEAESLHRDSLAQARRLKLAKLPQHAHPADIDLRTPRGLGKTRWHALLSLNWLRQHHHLLLLGPTGVGKSYLACALAKAAIDQKKSVRYLRLPRLADELTAIHAQGRLSHWLKTQSRIDLLILDDFGLVPLAPVHQPLLLELLEDRHQRGSPIVTSQLPLKLWHAQFHDPSLADAILDRLVHGAETVELSGESLRKQPPSPPAQDNATDRN
ncbi:IS21-like element helper ATPase IstB [Metallibacterium sp.]|uniref:IS21-like element helper ATPase IstB n=1 Tax=Metallibacterium sp. TaxID=2940281 RepID=UPI00263210F8|nr:IS21-like element helper ATPase IstB [Metallibacterium sp.]